MLLRFSIVMFLFSYSYVLSSQSSLNRRDFLSIFSFSTCAVNFNDNSVTDGASLKLGLEFLAQRFAKLSFIEESPSKEQLLRSYEEFRWEIWSKIQKVGSQNPTVMEVVIPISDLTSIFLEAGDPIHSQHLYIKFAGQTMRDPNRGWERIVESIELR